MYFFIRRRAIPLGIRSGMKRQEPRRPVRRSFNEVGSLGKGGLSFGVISRYAGLKAGEFFIILFLASMHILYCQEKKVEPTAASTTPSQLAATQAKRFNQADAIAD